MLALLLGQGASPEFITVGREERIDSIAELAETRQKVEISEQTDNASSRQRSDCSLNTPVNPAVRHYQVHCLHASIMRQARKPLENSRFLEVRRNESPSSSEHLEVLGLFSAKRTVPVVKKDVFSRRSRLKNNWHRTLLLGSRICENEPHPGE